MAIARTTFQCRCGERIPVAVTVGKPKPDASRTVLTVSFDKGQFLQDYAAHVMSAPELPAHAPYVIRPLSDLETP